jgi:hypothetical protein
MSVTQNPQRDWTAAPAFGYSRSPVAAVFNPSNNLRWPSGYTPGTPDMSDPSTGALADWPTAITSGIAPLPVAKRSTANFWFVASLLIVTVWLESGRSASL